MDELLSAPYSAMEKAAPNEDGVSTAALHRHAFQNSPYGIAVLSLRSYRIVEANDAFASLLGRPKEAVIGRSGWDWDVDVGEDDIFTIIAKDAPFEDDGGQLRFLETRWRRPDGAVIDVRVVYSYFRSDGDHIGYILCRDIGKEKQVMRALARSEAQFRALFNSTHRMVGMLTPDGKRIASNLAASEFTGSTADGTAGMELWECPWWREQDRPRIREAVQQAAQGETTSFEVTAVNSRGEARLCDITITPIRDEAGEIYMLMPEVQDVTQLRQTERELRSLLERSPDGIVRYDRELRRVFVNPTFERLIGQPKDELIGGRFENSSALLSKELYQEQLLEAFRTGGETEAEVKFQLPDQRGGWAHVRFMPEFDENDQVSHVLAAIRDITEMVENRRQIQALAFTDPLTGLANRWSFRTRLEAMLRDGKAGISLLILDIDRFKDINDSLGHAAGDELLSQIATRLRSCVRSNDLLARMGGDEFALVLAGYKRGHVKAVAERMKRVLADPFHIQGQEFFTSASIGVACAPDDGNSLEELTANADVAMYEVKKHGRHGIRFYSSELTTEVTRRLTRGTDLRSALGNEELELFYQPKIRFIDNCIIGAEALLRWRHPEQGLLSPAAFVDVAEDTGQIVDIGRWILETACKAVAEWNHICPIHKHVAVNLSPRQFNRHDIVGDIEGALAAAGCKGEWLECEITESLILRDEMDVQQALSSIHDMGVSVAIDDFGTGHSALSYLTRFNIDTLKIDRTFIDGIDTDASKAGLVKALLSIGDALNIDIVAEGVENDRQAEILRGFGCEFGQGFHFGAPVTGDEFKRRYLVT